MTTIRAGSTSAGMSYKGPKKGPKLVVQPKTNEKVTKKPDAVPQRQDVTDSSGQGPKLEEFGLRDRRAESRKTESNDISKRPLPPVIKPSLVSPPRKESKRASSSADSSKKTPSTVEAEKSNAQKNKGPPSQKEGIVSDDVFPLIKNLTLEHINMGRQGEVVESRKNGWIAAVPNIIKVSKDLTEAGLPTNPCLVMAHVDMESPGTSPSGRNPLQLIGAYKRGYEHLQETIGIEKVTELTSNWTPYEYDLALGVSYLNYNKDGDFGQYLESTAEVAKDKGFFKGNVFAEDEGLTIALAAYNGGVGSAANLIKNEEPYSRDMQRYANNVLHNAQRLDAIFNATGEQKFIDLCDTVPDPNPDVLPIIYPK